MFKLPLTKGRRWDRPKQKSTPGTLPGELLLAIFSHLEQNTRFSTSHRNDTRGQPLVSVVLVCAPWAEAGLEILYRTVRLGTKVAYTRFGEVLAERKDLAERVLSLEFPHCTWESKHLEPVYFWSRFRRSPPEDLARSFTEIVKMCPNLQRLCIPSVHLSHDPEVKAILRSLVHVQFETCVCVWRPTDHFQLLDNLQELSIATIQEGNMVWLGWNLNLPNPAIRLSCVTHIRLKNTILWVDLFGELLRVVQSTLKQLEVYNDHRPGGSANTAIWETARPLADTLEELHIVHGPDVRDLSFLTSCTRATISADHLELEPDLPVNLQSLTITYVGSSMPSFGANNSSVFNTCAHLLNIMRGPVFAKIPELKNLTICVEVEAYSELRDWRLAAFCLKEIGSTRGLALQINLQISQDLLNRRQASVAVSKSKKSRMKRAVRRVRKALTL